LLLLMLLAKVPVHLCMCTDDVACRGSLMCPAWCSTQQIPLLTPQHCGWPTLPTP